MKKIFLILTLLSLGVSKAQVVGGYLPLNSSKSATIGTVRTNSLVVTAPTISVNNKTLTAGNTGTVAVLSDAWTSLNMSGASTNPVDGGQYYFGNVNFAWLANQGGGKVYLPYNCTLVGWTANFYVNGTLGSNESSTLAIGVSNSYTNLSTAVLMTTVINTYSGTASQDISANSYIEARLTCPTWATNPTSVGIGITFWFVRRS